MSDFWLFSGSFIEVVNGDVVAKWFCLQEALFFGSVMVAHPLSFQNNILVLMGASWASLDRTGEGNQALQCIGLG